MSTPTANYVLRRVPVHNRQDIIVEDQDLNDIIKCIKKYHHVNKANYDEISREFWAGDAAKTSERLFDFLKKYVRYHVEPEHDQTIKSPGRIINEGYGDCKHYASFICGVVDSLERKGYPVHCCYRFVSDIPSKDIQHVFAVVQDKDHTLWVDPVLKSLDQRPTFHNTKDIAFSHGIGRLTYLSGTQMGDVEMGKISFKKALHNIKHGIDVNLHNAGKGASHIVHEAGQGIKKGAQAVAHIALKVGIAPARNAFLALLDVNGFNLANRVAHSHNVNGLKAAWKKMGGDPNKLMQAARNGQLFQAKLHHKSKSSVHGPYSCAGMGMTVHTRHMTTHPATWVRDYHMKHNRRMHPGMRNGRMDSPHMHRTSMVAGAMVGVEPVSIATLMSLASAVIAVLGKFLAKSTPAEETAMADQAKQGGAELADQAAAADAAEGNAKADTLQALTTPAGGADSSMNINTGTDATGNPQVTVHDVSHPALMNAGEPGGGAAADVTSAADGSGGAPADGGGGAPGENLTEKAKRIWRDYKAPIIGVGVGILLLKNKKIQKKFGF